MRLAVVASAAAVLALPSLALPANPPVKSLVMEGYDVVAYFSLAPGDDGVLGTESYSTTLNTTLSDGLTLAGSFEFRFSSQDNLDKFQASPWSYAPLYGGF